jgi:DNA-directed RNA polymerase subunit RPC12/RpoP
MAAIEFRCDKCGKLLSGDPQQNTSVACPQCGASVAVPAGLAALPRPQVPPNAAPPPPPPPHANAQAPQDDQQLEEPQQESELMRVMSAAMPWVFSLFLHLGVGLLMTFGVLVVMKANEVRAGNELEVVEDGTDQDDEGIPGGQLNPGDAASELYAQQRDKLTESKGYAKHESTVQGPDGSDENKTLQMIGMGGGGGGGTLAEFGADDRGGGSGYGPRSKFLGTGGRGHHLIYVIDRSGSMAAGGVFDQVKDKMADSIGQLGSGQDFHIILFADGPPIEAPPRKLVPASPDNKGLAGKFLGDRSIVARGQTDPVPALNRAFDVLAAGTKKGKVIYLLTDGAFKDNDAVLAAIRARNADKAVTIHTFLYGYTGGADEKDPVIKVMKQIAEENGPGKFRKVEKE